MKKQTKQVLRIILFIMLGAFVFWFVYEDLDVNKILSSLKQAEYKWIALSLLLGILSHISRARRWVLLIKPLGHNPKLSNSFFSVMIMYLSNIAVPRSGEFVRCSLMRRYENVSFSKLLGTVITERVFDFIMLFAMLAVVLVYQITDIQTLVENNPGVYEKFASIFTLNRLIVLSLVSLAVLTLMYIFRSKLKHTLVWKKLSEFLKNITEGIKTVRKMKDKGEFLFHTILIWVLYFLMIYVTFFAFDFTSNLTVMQALTVFVMASFGMVFPSPGGIGSWHFMVMQTLFIYGVHDMNLSGAFAFAAHGAMTMMLIVVGLISYILMPLMNKDRLSLPGNSNM
ncbi:MAG: lysylphosphatidylglycerol synthase transmembrane domain-containing protein [Bacteroidota bacterium]|nr:lysylphosphatidylglycerol synthase transmembrane domain-containing protein [Bacteroidota bacterium]